MERYNKIPRENDEVGDQQNKMCIVVKLLESFETQQRKEKLQGKGKKLKPL